jgi:arylformamidase
VLVNTCWDRRWRTDRYFEGHSFLTEAAATYLRDQAALVGVDYLAALPTDGFVFSAVPPKTVAMGTFPVHAHAILKTATEE